MKPRVLVLTTYYPPVLGGVETQARKWIALPPLALKMLALASVEKGAMDLVEAWQLANRPDALLVLVGPDMTGHPWDVGGPARADVAAHGLDDGRNARLIESTIGSR
jgi:hypothetical protein